MKTSKVLRTGELTGAALDWAVAKCEGAWVMDGIDDDCPEYSTNWSQGGPIIEREHISIEATRVGGRGDRWMASDMGHCTEFADAPLIAAMRCYVASKMGDTVEVPEELL